jgi:very-short-patch-repair endonuclease
LDSPIPPSFFKEGLWVPPFLVQRGGIVPPPFFKEGVRGRWDAERLLWQRLKRKQLAGVKFRRQYSVDEFVLDFYAPRVKLAIEIDGPMHLSEDARAYDEARTEHIEQFGIRILRVTNLDVYTNMEGVLLKIESTIREILMNHP